VKKFLKSRVLDEVITECGSKKVSMPKTTWIYPVVLVQYWLATNRHTTTAYTIASIALRSKRRFKYKLVKQRFAIVVQAVEDK